jgi:hypothetical protein
LRAAWIRAPFTGLCTALAFDGTQNYLKAKSKAR